MSNSFDVLSQCLQEIVTNYKGDNSKISEIKKDMQKHNNINTNTATQDVSKTQVSDTFRQERQESKLTSENNFTPTVKDLLYDMPEDIKTLAVSPEVQRILDKAYTKDALDALQKASEHYDPKYEQIYGISFEVYCKIVNRILELLGKSSRNRYIPSEEQLRILYSKAKRRLIDSAAGTGKTTTIIIDQFLEQNIFKLSNKDILSITYTNSGAKAMQDKFDSLCRDLDSQRYLEFSTIHSYCRRLVEAFDGQKNILTNSPQGVVVEMWVENPDFDEEYSSPEEFEIYEERVIRQSDLIQQAFDKTGIPSIQNPGTDSIINALAVISECMITSEEEFRDNENYTDYVLSYIELMQINKLYSDMKKEYDLIDFSDMLCRGYDILSQIYEGKLQCTTDTQVANVHFKSIYIDEVQDISLLQSTIVSKLLEINTDARITFIGDADQGIFSFRGACVDFILSFPEKYCHDDLDIIYLTRNRRSYKNIIDFSNKIISNNQIRYKKLIRGIENDTRLQGTLAVIPDKYSLVSHGMIKNMVLEDEKTNSFLGLRNMAILYREHNQCFDISTFLIKNRIPFRCDLPVDSQYYIINTKEMKDIYGIYMMLAMPNNDYFVKTSLYKIVPRLTRQNAEHIAFEIKRNPNLKILSFLKKNPMYEPTIPKLINLFQKVQSNCSIFDFFYELLPLYKEAYYTNFITNFNKPDLTPHVLDYVKGYGKLNTFKAQLDIDKEWLRLNSKNVQGISLTTFHASKGLEWETVFILPISDNITPKPNVCKKLSSQGRVKYVEEERRLLYVAVTRAIKNLYVFYQPNKDDSAGYFGEELVKAYNQLQGVPQNKEVQSNV